MIWCYSATLVIATYCQFTNWKSTCHMGSHSVTCHPTEVRIPPLPPAKTGTRFSDPGGMQGWVDLCYVNADQPGVEPATCKSQVQRPTAEPPHNTLCTVMNAIFLHLSQASLLAIVVHADIGLSQQRNLRTTGSTDRSYTTSQAEYQSRLPGNWRQAFL